MKPSLRLRHGFHILLLPLLTTRTTTITAAETSLPSKRGLAYVRNDHTPDNRLMLSDNSSMSWYYTWSLNMAGSVGGTIMFLPLIHSLEDAADPGLVATLGKAPDSSTHLLSFNEPDGTTASGGSSISPGDAARSYLQHIAPLRREGGDGRSRTWRVSHPSVTGSDRDLDWLRDFNRTCYEIDRLDGCPSDFVAVHWYGNFEGLAAWLGTLREFYTEGAGAGSGARGDALSFWITEMALPQADGEATLRMMNSSLPYLDRLDWVGGYSWFGAFRRNEANEWTGDQVALFDDGGGLTDIGALYLGGEAKGFTKGMTGGAAGGGARGVPGVWSVVAAVGLVTTIQAAMWR